MLSTTIARPAPAGRVVSPPSYLYRYPPRGVVNFSIFVH